MELGFTSLEQECENILLPVAGTVPKWLSGTLIRNGAAKFEIGKESYNHWFDGLAMLHKFTFRNGQILYTNKFLKGHTFRKSMKKGEIVYPEFATNPKYSLPSRVFLYATGHYTDNASVNVSKVGDSFITMTETPHRVEFDPESLNTLGRFHYMDRVTGHLTTVHPQFDYEKEQIFNYITRFSHTSTYNIYRIRKGSARREIISTIPVKRAAYMHSFGMTENYVILTEFPLFINPLRFLLTGSPFIDNLFWKPEHGTTFLVIDKNSGKMIGKFKSDPFFAFHHINCYEETGNVIVDIVSYEDPSIIKYLYLDKLRQGNFLIPTPQIRRYYLDLSNNKVLKKILSEDFVEFPRINYQRCNTKNYNFVYGISDHESNGFTNKLVKFCIKSKSFKCWHKENNFPGEPVFVAAPPVTAEEDEGVILSLVLDTEKHKTYLLILDATSFLEIARANLPFAVPFGSHGQYFE
ncbi:MAG: Apocarotenoid-15,15'-oxygenase [Pelotomaculum sp. PtaB.Bin104]|nr:MAG: Apocarotenoid-15,15'-oxygenase [Pelotomaculum sp. PtaB.Bin104]